MASLFLNFSLHSLRLRCETTWNIFVLLTRPIPDRREANEKKNRNGSIFIEGKNRLEKPIPNNLESDECTRYGKVTF